MESKFAVLREELEQIKNPEPFSLMSDVYARQVSFFGKLAELMLDMAEDAYYEKLAFPGTVMDSLHAIETKIGVNNSEDPFSIDYRVRHLEQHLEHEVWI